MRTKILIATLATTTIAFGASTLYLNSQLNQARDRVDAESQVHSETQARTQQAMTELKAANAQLQTATSASMSSASSSSLSVTPALTANCNEPPKPLPAAVSPQMDKELSNKLRKQMTLDQYGDLIRNLKLSPEEADQLIAVLVDRQTKMTDLVQSRDIDASTKKAKLDELKSAADDAVLAKLGSAKFDQYQDYEKHVQDHLELRQIRLRLSAARLPAPTEDQEKQLLTALIEERELIPRPSNSPTPNPEYQQDVQKWFEDVSRRKLARVEKILSAEQFAQYRQYLEMQSGSMTIMF